MGFSFNISSVFVVLYLCGVEGDVLIVYSYSAADEVDLSSVYTSMILLFKFVDVDGEIVEE